MSKVDIEKIYLNEIKNNVRHKIWDTVFEYIKENRDKYSDDGIVAIYDILDLINSYNVDKGEIRDDNSN